jgi:hypothetical protein
MFDVFYSGIKPGVLAHELHADSIEHARQLSRTEYFWWITYLSDYGKFDFLYVPPTWQGQYTHTWPSQHHEYSGTYLVPRAAVDIQYHFHTEILPNKRSLNHYRTLTQSEFDHTWAPHPHDPPYIYVFGNQWWPAETWPTVEYHVPGATERKYMDTPRAALPQNPNRSWYNVVADCDWDYSWRPDPGDPPYIYVFGNQWWPAEKMPTVEYRTPGATERKFMSWPRAILLPSLQNWKTPTDVNIDDFDFTWQPDPGSPPLIYQFGTQWQRTGGPQYVVPGATEVKYQTCPRAVKTSKDANWLVPDGADADTFDWTWHPDATEPPYMYQFATQHQRTGGPQYIVPGATEVKYVDQIRIEILANSVAIYEIDHLDGNAGHIPNTVRRVRYFDNYRDTLIRLAKSIGDKHEYVWVCSSICDYTGFDFSWHPEAWQATMLHVFASNEQKFGDTFFMHVPTFAARAESKALLDWYDVNYVPNISVPRYAMPVVQHTGDSHVDRVKTHSWTAPLTLFTVDTDPPIITTVNLWRDKTKTIVPLSPGATSVIVPQSAVPYVKTQLYDYPYIDKNFYKLNQFTPQDIVFISYDEPEADENWKKLSQRFPAKRVDGVKGMEAALEAAADQSSTPWYYAVFAKTQLSDSFDFSFVPDRMQQPKHYIFDCKNQSNGLVYGHMGIVLYNVDGIRTINNIGNFGIDYTLSFPHESIPILSCLGDFATTPYHAWRTAFRECAKLAYFESNAPSVDGTYRLQVWQNKASGRNSEWVLNGAQDGVEFFNSTQGNLNTLKNSFRWDWLREYFENKYGGLE